MAVQAGVLTGTRPNSAASRVACCSAIEVEHYGGAPDDVVLAQRPDRGRPRPTEEMPSTLSRVAPGDAGAAQAGAISLLSCQGSTRPRLRATTGTNERHRSADLANVPLTTAVEIWGRPWTPTRANTSYGPASWTVADRPGRGNPPEKRKVGSSTHPEQDSLGPWRLQGWPLQGNPHYAFLVSGRRR
jgi:hypothetical protein